MGGAWEGPVSGLPVFERGSGMEESCEGSSCLCVWVGPVSSHHIFMMNKTVMLYIVLWICPEILPSINSS